MTPNINNKKVLDQLLHKNLQGQKQEDNQPLYVYVLQKQPLILADGSFRIKAELQTEDITVDQLDQQIMYMIDKYSYSIQYYKNSFLLFFKLLVRDIQVSQQIRHCNRSNHLVDIENDPGFKDLCEQIMMKFSRVTINKQGQGMPQFQKQSRKFGLFFNKQSCQGLTRMMYQKEQDIEFRDVRDYDHFLEVVIDSDNGDQQSSSQDSQDIIDILDDDSSIIDIDDDTIIDIDDIEHKQESELDCIQIDSSQDGDRNVKVCKKIRKYKR